MTEPEETKEQLLERVMKAQIEPTEYLKEYKKPTVEEYDA